VYDDYKGFCEHKAIEVMCPSAFGKLFKKVFPHITVRRLGPRGENFNHYYNLGRKGSPSSTPTPAPLEESAPPPSSSSFTCTTPIPPLPSPHPAVSTIPSWRNGTIGDPVVYHDRLVCQLACQPAFRGSSAPACSGCRALGISRALNHFGPKYSEFLDVSTPSGHLPLRGLTCRTRETSKEMCGGDQS
jgi:hypothetical protein